MDDEQLLEKIKDFILHNYMKEIAEVSMSDDLNSLVINFQTLDEYDPDLADALLDEPQRIITLFNNAVKDIELPVEVENIHVRFSNLPSRAEIPIRKLRSKHIGKFVSLRGIVRAATDVRPTMTVGTFECPSCGTLIEVIQTESKLRQPTMCSCGRKGRFKLVDKKLVDTQKIIVEEMPELLEGAEQPKRLTIFLAEDLVDPKMEKVVTPGSKVIVNGILKEVPLTSGGSQLTKFDIVLDANYIEPIETEFEDIKITKEDEAKIREFSRSPTLFKDLVDSIAPTIYGHEKIKEAILLQLFGGVKKVRPDGTKTRGDMHILLIGDPGTAKSQLLYYVSNVAPKARYVSGKGTSSAGLTATVTKDDTPGGGWILEAGALPLTNKGILMVDEIDKMDKQDVVAMHEGLEQQRISISKANIHATLRCETSVLAAANPKYGRFNPYEPIPKQIDLPPPLLNRFDLIFTIRDLPSRHLDEKLARHVLNIHSNPEAVVPKVDKDFLRKYIAYAKRTVRPVLTKEAMDVIVDFYVSLRNKSVSSEGEVQRIAISARQLEALVRLSEASARVKLKDKVEVEDAKRAIELLSFSLRQVATDEKGEIDVDKITGMSAVRRGKLYKIRNIIEELSSNYDNGEIPIEAIVERAKQEGIEERDAREIISNLIREGEIYEPKYKFVKISPI